VIIDYKFKMAHLSSDEKTMLLLHYERLLVKKGLVDIQFESVEELCDFYGVARNYAPKLRKKFLESNTLERPCGSGRPCVDKEERTTTLITKIREKRDITIRDLATSSSIPRSTVQRLLVEDNVSICSKRSIPLLNAAHMATRLKFCRQHRKNSWDNWVDIDEKWFERYNFKKKERLVLWSVVLFI
jgi:hypothetical protein